MKHLFYWVDAFTKSKFGGNPCAVVFSADSLTDLQMLTIAKEMNLSETAFVVASSKADFGARYFTPCEEIPLAGHPTMATIRALIADGKIDLRNGRTKISLELKAGVIEIEAIRDNEDIRIVMAQKKPIFGRIHESMEAAGLFGLDPGDLMAGFPVQTVSTGTPQLMVPVKDHAALKKACLQVEACKRYKAKSDFFSPHLFCLQGATPAGRTFARHLGVAPDTAEDAFTGSANGGMAAYLWHYQLIKDRQFVAEQGHWMGRPGSAEVEIVGEANDIQTVKVAGSAVVLIQGELAL